MTQDEMVTDFAIRRNWKPGERPGTVRDPELAPVKELLTALNAHLKAKGMEPEEYGFASLTVKYDNPDFAVPSRYRWLVAYAVEGGSEGYYVHVGAIIHGLGHDEPTTYVDFGFAKTWSAETAYAIAREAQRFLTAAEWN
jgi:hypothetical protein